MNRVALAFYKAVLLAYPAEFRRDYGDALVQSFVDRHRHGGDHLVPLVLSEVVDAARVAPLMRWESPMHRTVIIVTGTIVAAAVALTVSPVALIPIAVAGFAVVLWWLRQRQPIGPDRAARRGVTSLVLGVAGIGAAVLIPAVDGGELSEFWWTVFAATLLGGIALAALGLVHAAGERRTTETTAR